MSLSADTKQQLYGALLAEVKEDVLQLRQEMRTNVSDLKTGMDNLARSFAESQRAPWATLGVWAGVLVAFGGLVATGLAGVGTIVATGLLRDVDRNASHISDLYRNSKDDKVSLETTKGTAESAAAAVKKLDTDLQREMADKDQTLRTLIEERTMALEARIEAQIKEKDQAITRIRDEQFSRAFDRISKIERWMETELGICGAAIQANGTNHTLGK